MNVVILDTTEFGFAPNRVLKALQKKGVNAKMIVRTKFTDDESVITINTSWITKKINYLRFAWERFIIFLNNKFNRSDLFRVSIANTGNNLINHPIIKNADIIHLHWINHGFLSLKSIHSIIKTGKPVVWTMHDMWPCTGICHHARECINFTNECGNCFYLTSNKKNDLSYRVFQKKKELIYANNITLVGCSKWLANKAKISNLSKNQNIVSIPNPINISLFDITDKMHARKMFNLPSNKQLILFGAININDKRKGIDYLVEGIKNLQSDYHKSADNIELVVMGNVNYNLDTMFNIPVHNMGYINEKEKVVGLYNASDIFVTPSLDENLPNVIMEAMACGIPCVGFNTGGIPEMIDHKQNGYVAYYEDAADLAKGINWILNEADYNVLSENARKKVVESYSEDIVTDKYMQLYKNLLN